jgi:tetratricopeptide (TPR) repeat protein
MAYLADKKYKEAIEQEKNTLELNPKAAGAFWIRGMAYQQNKMYEEAIKDFKHALEISSGDANYLAALDMFMHQVEIMQRHGTFLTPCLLRTKMYPYLHFFSLLFMPGLMIKKMR